MIEYVFVLILNFSHKELVMDSYTTLENCTISGEMYKKYVPLSDVTSFECVRTKVSDNNIKDKWGLK